MEFYLMDDIWREIKTYIFHNINIHGIHLKNKPDIKNYNCTINCSDWDIVDNILNYKINANRFLHHMVRMLVGTMLDVSRGNISKNDFLRLFDEGASKNKVLTAPAKGLYLLKVKY